MGRMFKNAPRKGAPLSLRGIANGLAAIDYALTNMRVENGRVVWSMLGAPTLMFGDDGAGASPAFLEAIQNAVRSIPGNFGYTVAGAVVSIVDSFCYRGGVAIDVAADDVTITGDGQWVVLEYNPGTDAAAFGLWTSAGKPADHDGLVVRGLHQFDLDADGNAVEIFDARWGAEIAMMGY